MRILCYIVVILGMPIGFAFSQSEIDTSKWDYTTFNGDTVLIKKVSKADLFIQNGDLINAIKELKINYLEDSMDRMNLYSLSEVYALNYNIDSSLKYLKLSLKGDSTLYLAENPSFLSLIKTNDWSSILNNQIFKFQVCNGNIKNIDLAKELWDMSMKDQAYYFHIELIQKDMGYNNPVVKVLWGLKSTFNDYNKKRLEEIIRKDGWPCISEVGSAGAKAAFLIVQHADFDTQKMYLPLMKEAAENNEAEWSALALLIDRVNIGEGKKQIYGSQVTLKLDGTFEIKDLEAPQYVNQRRAKIGLPPIEFYAEMYGIDWTIEQKTLP